MLLVRLYCDFGSNTVFYRLLHEIQVVLMKFFPENVRKNKNLFCKNTNNMLWIKQSAKTRKIEQFSVDTPFLTDLKTQTSPIERLVMLHIVLVLKFQSLSCEPCLRTSGLFCALPRIANPVPYSPSSLPEEGRGLVDHLSVAVGYVLWS